MSPMKTILLLGLAAFQGLVVAARTLHNPAPPEPTSEVLVFKDQDSEESLLHALPSEAWFEEDVNVQECISSNDVFIQGIPGGPGPEPVLDTNGPCTSVVSESDYRTLCGACKTKLETLAVCLRDTTCEYPLSPPQERFVMRVEAVLNNVINECNKHGYRFFYPSFPCP